MTPYQVLVDVLDQLRSEAPPEYRTYHPPVNDVDKLNSARSKALLHLFLKVRFGLLTFSEREKFVTEGADDGGIDAYYIDDDRKQIYFLQAKFRTTEKTFEEKRIDPEELLAMDINRILEGETSNIAGTRYNAKILAMIRAIKEITDIGRYHYRVVILANAKGVTREKITTLTSGYLAELIDYQTCYSTLLFPLVSGTYFNADQLELALSLSNKSPGAKISYTVDTEFTKCEITVVFVPTLEIARTMFKYRNSILKYNPRSYVAHEGKKVNAEIRRSIENRHTNEFALFNNGITILSDETHLNERIGHKERAQLVLLNPQIINGGQTAYTLSIIYRQHLQGDLSLIFGEKEVLVKIITFEEGKLLPEAKKLQLIEDISRATNQQTAVTNADRRSNEHFVKELQKKLFDRTGLFIERKKGEFEDGLREGYIKESEIIERSVVYRTAFAVQGQIVEGARRKIASQVNFEALVNVADETFDKYGFALLLLARLAKGKKGPLPVSGSILTKVYFGIRLFFKPGMSNLERNRCVEAIAPQMESLWKEFVAFVGVKRIGPMFKGHKRSVHRSFEYGGPHCLDQKRPFLRYTFPAFVTALTLALLPRIVLAIVSPPSETEAGSAGTQPAEG